MVLGFHAFSRYPEIFPYGDQYANFPGFSMGWLGVQLFFLISGYVILMTLDRCENASQFLYRRWLRLFPAMLICSSLVFCTASLFPERPSGAPTLLNFLPGLTFIEESWWSALLGVKVGLIEGAFWSLFVEFKFYVIAAIVFFTVGRVLLVYCLLAFYLVSLILLWAEGAYNIIAIDFLHNIATALSFHQFGWFAAGSALYIFSETKNKNWFYFCIAICLLSSLLVRGPHLKLGLVAFSVSCLFFMSFVSSKLRTILASKVLLFFGFVSYPLYLIHEGAMVSMIVKIGQVMPTMPGYLYPIIPVCVLAGISYCIVSFAEKPLKNCIVFLFNRVKI